MRPEIEDVAVRYLYGHKDVGEIVDHIYDDMWAIKWSRGSITYHSELEMSIARDEHYGLVWKVEA